MKWILGAFFGLIIAFFIYGMTGAIANLVAGPLLGYKIQGIFMWGFALIKEDGKYKMAFSEFRFIPEVLLDANMKSRSKKLILDILPIILGFIAGMVITAVFGDVKGIWRHILVGTVSGMSILYCWHIFIALKMFVYMKENRKE